MTTDQFFFYLFMEKVLKKIILNRILQLSIGGETIKF